MFSPYGYLHKSGSFLAPTAAAGPGVSKLVQANNQGISCGIQKPCIMRCKDTAKVLEKRVPEYSRLARRLNLMHLLQDAWCTAADGPDQV